MNLCWGSPLMGFVVGAPDIELVRRVSGVKNSQLGKPS